MKPLIIYHAHCSDGFGAAFAAWLKFGDNAEYLPMSYGDWPKLFEGYPQGGSKFDYREVYILDFSFDKVQMNVILHSAEKVIWLDHHKSAFENWCGYPADNDSNPGVAYNDGTRYEEHPDQFMPNRPTIILDNNKSGAMLAWEYFHPNVDVPVLVKHIDDYDRWQFKIGGTKEFNKALSSYPQDFKVWHFLWLVMEEANNDLYQEGRAILRYHNQNVKAVIDAAKQKCTITMRGGKWEGLSANCPGYLSSDVGHELANESGTFGLAWYTTNTGKVKCSLRSNGDYDVTLIAKAFGGGGHKNAAGFEVPIDILLGWMR